MNVVVPYAPDRLRPETVAATRHVGAWYAECDSTYGYWGLLARAWQVREPFIIVEQDVLPPDGALDELWECPEVWCSFPYQCRGVMRFGLGCTSFKTPVMVAVPDLFTRMPKRHWSLLDVYVDMILGREGFRPHLHQPVAVHLNESHQAPDGPEVFVLAMQAGDQTQWLHVPKEMR